jgi:hypothetical protein
MAQLWCCSIGLLKSILFSYMHGFKNAKIFPANHDLGFKKTKFKKTKLKDKNAIELIHFCLLNIESLPSFFLELAN